MADLENLEQRVTELERARIIDDAVRGGLDADMVSVQGHLRALQRSVQALHLTQSDHTRALGELRDGQRQIVTLLTQLIDRDEQRPPSP